MSSRPVGSSLRELTLTRIRMFTREPEALFWTFIFPVLMAGGLGIAFRERPPQPVPVAVERGAAEGRLAALRADREIAPRVMDSAEAERALRTGTVSLVVAAAGPALVLRFDPAREDSRVARLLVDGALQRAAGARRPAAVTEDRKRVRGGRYIDWVVPGLLGLNLMSTGLWGSGFGIVQSRQKKLLKRLLATPMRKRDFLMAQMIARLAFLGLEVPPLVLFAWLAFGVRVEGSLLLLSGVVMLGTLCFAGMGLLCASRARTIEGISGILNFVMVPMFVASGIFFSAARFPAVAQPFVQALPLTALNDALRLVYNEGAGFAAVAPEAAILAAWTVASFVAAFRLFRWQ
jgi:ABC-type multidrug transport system permease subunit